MHKIWVNKAKNFKEAEAFDMDYYASMTPEERLDTVQYLRELNFKIKPSVKNAHRKGLRRVYRILKQK